MEHLQIEISPLIGRQDELAQIAALFDDPACRLLTLIGPGGIGKTRLALEITYLFEDAHFVSLQPVAAPESIVPAIANALGFSFQTGSDLKQQLLNYLHQKSWLLVLDNFEHLLDGAALLSEILARAPHVRLLVTSRERLNLLEEWALEVDGLEYPPSDGNLERYSAVELFTQHARRVKVGFTMTDTSRPLVGRICRLVGGIPLGIELAASWVRALSIEAIADEIARSLDILETRARNVEPRHRTMRAAFEPTWERLSAEERDVFMSLSVFRGGFTREAAEQIAGASLRTLTALLDKSLLRADTGGRFGIHELLRQYAEEKRGESDEFSATGDAHSIYFAAFVCERVDDLKGRRQLEALAEIVADFENVRTAWTWAVDHRDANTVAKMVEGVWQFCTLRSREHEVEAMFRYAEHQFSDDARYERLLARLVSRCTVDDTVAQRKRLETALQIARRYEDMSEIAHCSLRLGIYTYFWVDAAAGKQLLEESLECYLSIGDRFGAADVLFQRMSSLMRKTYAGMWDDFIRDGTESLRLRREINDRIGIAWSIAPVAQQAAREGRFSEAERLWEERIAIGYEVDAQALVALGYAHVSHDVWFTTGNFERARAAAEEAIRIGNKVNHGNPVGFGLATLGLLASMDERYAEGQALCLQGASATQLGWIADNAAWGIAIANCGLGDYAAAYDIFPAAFKHRIALFSVTGLIACLPIAAILMAEAGNAQRAVELLALALTYPSRASGWIEKWPLIKRLRAELEHRLGAEAYAAAWESGALLNTDEIEAGLLEELSQPTLALRNNPALPAGARMSLSERELDVLRLVAEGYSNQEIADALFIGVSTVKKHINHIYDKLDAKNRTQAVAVARSLHVLP